MQRVLPFPRLTDGEIENRQICNKKIQNGSRRSLSEMLINDTYNIGSGTFFKTLFN